MPFRRQFLLSLLFVMASLPAAANDPLPAPPAVFQLFAVVPNADFDETALAKIDTLKIFYPKGSNFAIGDLPAKRGRFTLLKFLLVHTGETSEGRQLVHELLVLKVDKGSIHDACLWTLEWQDSPSARLARMRSKPVPLRAGMSLSLLNLRLGGEPDWIGNAVLDNVLDGKKRF
jgi:hypothetical protein